MTRSASRNAKSFLDLADGEAISFDASATSRGQIATLLLAQGVGVSDSVAVQAPKTPEVLALYAACLQIGVVLLPLNRAYTPVEIRVFPRRPQPAPSSLRRRRPR